ncbi:MAG: hypothetical protein FJ091_03475 [Deltaproteobacteria bacterium]|nr:hypothetical protein [Deltaproteobacteria bacterium]
MAVSRTEDQLEALKTGDPTERLALVSLFAVRDAAAWPAFLAAHDGAAKASMGARAYFGRVEAVLVGTASRFDFIAIDEFPSRELAAESLRLENPHAKDALAEAVTLVVRPRRAPALALAAMRLAARIRGRGEGAQKRPLTDAPQGDAAIEPPHRELEAFLSAQPSAPLVMLNLNRHRERASYANPAEARGDASVSGKAAYARYGANTLPFVLRRGRGPVFLGEPIGLAVGDAGHALAGPWHELLLVHYRERSGMLDMLTAADYQAGLPHRNAGLERAALIATSPA